MRESRGEGVGRKVKEESVLAFIASFVSLRLFSLPHSRRYIPFSSCLALSAVALRYFLSSRPCVSSLRLVVASRIPFSSHLIVSYLLVSCGLSSSLCRCPSYLFRPQSRCLTLSSYLAPIASRHCPTPHRLRPWRLIITAVCVSLPVRLLRPHMKSRSPPPSLDNRNEKPTGN